MISRTNILWRFTRWKNVKIYHMYCILLRLYILYYIIMYCALIFVVERQTEVVEHMLNSLGSTQKTIRFVLLFQRKRSKRGHTYGVYQLCLLRMRQYKPICLYQVGFIKTFLQERAQKILSALKSMCESWTGDSSVRDRGEQNLAFFLYIKDTI